MSIWTEVPTHYVAPPALPVLAVGNLKGGVGKTAVVTYLAFALALKGYRVLAIDLDFQASLSTAFNRVKLGDDFDGTSHFLQSESTDVLFDIHVVKPCVPPWTNLTAVRASFDLADIEDRLFAQLVLGSFKRDPRTLLASKLADASLRHDFDVVLLDTPPRLTITSINALCACTHILIPTAPTQVSIKGADTFVKLLRIFKGSLCPNLSIMSILPTLLFNASSRFGLDEIERVPVWNNFAIFRSQSIANGEDFSNKTIENMFNPLADEIVHKMGVRRNGPDASLRPVASPRLSR